MNIDPSAPENISVSLCVLDAEAMQFMWDQGDLEIELDCYSPSFGPDLLPGMFSPPIDAVPKPHSDKLWLINDHSAGTFSLNLWIKKEDATLCLDNLQDFGSLLKTAQTHFGCPPAYILNQTSHKLILDGWCTHFGRSGKLLLLLAWDM